MRKVAGTTLILGIASMSAVSFGAQGPDIAQVLAIKPAQPDVVYDQPSKDTWGQCKLEVIREPSSGWVVRDARGLEIRKFLDTNGDKTVDRWSYFMNGQEVYRDVDTNGNGKPDQHRWFQSAGSRWGVDEKEDGVVDRWKVISAEEASAEAVAAIASRKIDRLLTIMLTEEDYKTLGLKDKAVERVKNAQKDAIAKFKKLQTVVPSTATWNRFDGNNPTGIPGDTADCDSDLMVYQNATIIADANGQTVWLRVPEIVKVGDVWKLTDVPAVIDNDKAGELAGVLIPAFERMVVENKVENDNAMVEENKEVQQFVEALQKHDESVPENSGNVRAMIAYHVKRAELCARVGSLSKKLKNREHWYKQTADSLNAAVQTGEYPQGIATLKQYAGQFAKTSWGVNLAAYFDYRAINSDYATKLATPNGDHGKAQEAFLTELKKFLTDYPSADDIDDALLQLGNGAEFAGNEDEAIAYYKKLTDNHPNTPPSIKAAGALRRIQSVGQPFQLAGGSIDGRGGIDTAKMRGRVLIISYWATWCEPCKSEMPRLTKLREKYGPQGLEVVGVCLDGDRETGADYVKKSRYTWPQIYEEGSMDSAPAVRYGIISLPYVILVDAEGRVVNRNVQFAQLEAELEKLMAKELTNQPGSTNRR